MILLLLLSFLFYFFSVFIWQAEGEVAEQANMDALLHKLTAYQETVYQVEF